MRQLLIVSGVLGSGTVLVFAAAALVAAMFPTGALVPTNPWGSGGGQVQFVRPAGGPVWSVDVSGGDGGVLTRPIPIGPGLQVDQGNDVVVVDN